MIVRELMTRAVKTIAPDASIQEAVDLMADFNVGALPVCSHEALVGILTDRDVVLRCVALHKSATEMRVGDAMTRSPVTVQAHQSVEDAARQIGIQGYRRL